MNLGFNWFDVMLLAVLGGGMVQGRKRGMSREWMGLLKWLVILFGCAAVNRPLGELISRTGVFGMVSACLVAYLGAMLLLVLAFAWAERRWRKKSDGTDFFGRGEYYLAMASGTLRAGCVLLVGLALLHARSFTPAEIEAIEAYQSSNYGSHVFPSLPAVQASVFDTSLTGPWIRQNLGFLLITPQPN